MKIALFHNLPAGGAKRALYEHARKLRARGHVLDLYTLSSAAEEFLPLGPLCRESFVTPEPAPRRPLARRLLDLPSFGPEGPGERVRHMVNGYAALREHLGKLEDLEQVYTRMAADIDARGYDLVYVHHCRFLLAPYLLRRLETPSVYFCQDTQRHVHEWSVDTPSEYDTLSPSWARRKFQGRLVSPLLLRAFREEERRDTANARAATLVLANSCYSREAILRVYGRDARVCYLGVDAEFFRPDPTVDREKVVLSVGSLLPTKRHDLIVEAIATLPASRRPEMRIIGYDTGDYGDAAPGPAGEALLRLAERRGVRLHLSKGVSDEVLRDAYRRASVVAFAPYLEPFGFVPLEAMACGTPVVGVREGGVRETIEDGVNGLLSAAEPEAFGAALDRLLTDRPLAATLGSQGRELAACRWTWERSVDMLERYVEPVVRRARAAEDNEPQ